MNLGHFQTLTEDWKGAKASLEEAIHYLTTYQHDGHLGFALANSASVAWQQGDKRRYHELSRQQLDLISRTHDPAAAGILLLSLCTNAHSVNLTPVTREGLRLIHRILGNPPHFTGMDQREEYQTLVRSIKLEPSESFVPQGNLCWDSLVHEVRQVAQEFAEIECDFNPFL
jgi:hypothetical protein